MFKNMIIYRITSDWSTDLTALEDALSGQLFQECGATQEKSGGWVPPRGEAHGALAESVGGHWILRFMLESKMVPGPVLARKVQEKATQIEQHTGRKPGKKESRELKEEAKLDLLPMAFTKQTSVWIWIDRDARLLVLDTASQACADEIVTLLVKSLTNVSLSLVETQVSPQAAMSQWLLEQEAPAGFSIDRECELKSVHEAKSVVRYARHPLEIEEVQEHIQAGKLPTQLALTWDDRVSFLLTDTLQIKKVAFQETVFEDKVSGDSGFDADVALATGELSRFIPDLLAALGGERRNAAVTQAIACASEAPF